MRVQAPKPGWWLPRIARNSARSSAAGVQVPPNDHPIRVSRRSVQRLFTLAAMLTATRNSPGEAGPRAGCGGGSAEVVDAEREVEVPDPVAGQAHRQHARSLYPVGHAQVAGVPWAQSEALDER